MRLSQCTHGILVQKTDKFSRQATIGMVVGVTTNVIDREEFREERENPDNAIALVQWQNGETYGIHPANISRLKG